MFANVKRERRREREREREREILVQARQSKHCIGGSTSRERERGVCVLFEFRQFFYSGNSSTCFKVLCRSFAKKSDRTRC